MEHWILSALLLLPLLFFPLRAPAGEFPPPERLPALELLEQAALGRAGLQPDKIQRWQRNSRRAVALPRLQIGFEQSDQQNNTAIIQDSISVTSSGITIGPESNRVDQDFGNDRGFEVKAVWALDELLFNRDEIEISREARDLTLIRGRLQEELRDTYFLLKAQLWRFQAEPSLRLDPTEVLQAQQRAARLDSLSGGAFRRLAKDFVLPLPPPESFHLISEKTHEKPQDPPNKQASSPAADRRLP
ncbi:MAG TPA: hypothetical protein VJR29_07225 [bacterium]|nr:hypothetical protein [bacterium]